MKHIALLTCVCGLMLLGSCKNQSAQNEQPLEVMTFNVRLDAPSDSANNWKYRKDNVPTCWVCRKYVTIKWKT